MSDHIDFEFSYRGHRVQVSHIYVPDGWLGDYDTVFTVVIDDAKTVIPGIWRAYKTNGEEGIKLVLRAFLDCLPTRRLSQPA